MLRHGKVFSKCFSQSYWIIYSVWGGRSEKTRQKGNDLIFGWSLKSGRVPEKVVFIHQLHPAIPNFHLWSNCQMETPTQNRPPTTQLHPNFHRKAKEANVPNLTTSVYTINTSRVMRVAYYAAISPHLTEMIKNVLKQESEITKILFIR